jgi:hypothetical protein
MYDYKYISENVAKTKDEIARNCWYNLQKTKTAARFFLDTKRSR